MGSLEAKPRVALLVTCLVDMFRPELGFASLKLLEMSGCDVEVPELQTCCGQPAYNTGDRKTGKLLAKQMIEQFDGYEYVVGPSGSCVGMLHYYPELLKDEPSWLERAELLKSRAFEIGDFLVNVRPLTLPEQEFNQEVTYHDSCSGLRQLGIKHQPRALLSQVKGVEISEMEEAETCCGFGGTFCVKYPEISNRMVSNKTSNISASGAPMLLGGDLGCLLNMAGKLSREGKAVHARHYIEILAGMTDTPAIGERSSDLAYEAGR